MNGLSRRALRSWSARANSSLPVPDSPSSSTVADVLATRSHCVNATCNGGASPMMPKRRDACATDCSSSLLRASSAAVRFSTAAASCRICPESVARIRSIARSSASGRTRERMRWQAMTPMTRRPSNSGTAMNATVSGGRFFRSTIRARKAGSASMSWMMIALPVASTRPVMPSPAAYWPRAISARVSPYA